LLNGILASFALSIAVWGLIVPYLTPVFPSVQLARAMRSVECSRPLAAAAGFHEPSLVFMVGTQTVLTDGNGAADFLQQGPCRFAMVDSRQEMLFAQRGEAIGLRFVLVTRVDGYNYSQGRNISMGVFRSEGTE
jgi:hypothetical protein